MQWGLERRNSNVTIASGLFFFLRGLPFLVMDLLMVLHGGCACINHGIDDLHSSDQPPQKQNATAGALANVRIELRRLACGLDLHENPGVSSFLFTPVVRI